MLRVIKDKKPKFFVAENVKGILSLAKGEVFNLIKSDFENLGYKVEAKLLNAAEYGVPQQRERVFIIGSRITNKILFPDKTHSFKDKTLKKVITTEDAIGWLEKIRTADDPINYNNKLIYNHVASDNVSDKFWGRKFEVDQHEICDYLKHWRSKAKISTNNIDKHFGYSHTAGHWFRKDNNSGSIPKPSDWWELKNLLKFDDKFDEVVTTYVEKEIKFEQSLRITNWNRPSDTITATSPEIHVNKWRRLSVRECAILQTFPDNFVFHGTLGKMYKQIGNAVPVLLASKVASKIKFQLDEFYK